MQEWLTGDPGYQFQRPEDPDGPQRLEVHTLLLSVGLPRLAARRGHDGDEPEASNYYETLATRAASSPDNAAKIYCDFKDLCLFIAGIGLNNDMFKCFLDPCISCEALSLCFKITYFASLYKNYPINHSCIFVPLPVSRWTHVGAGASLISMETVTGYRRGEKYFSATDQKYSSTKYYLYFICC